MSVPAIDCVSRPCTPCAGAGCPSFAGFREHAPLHAAHRAHPGLHSLRILDGTRSSRRLLSDSDISPSTTIAQPPEVQPERRCSRPRPSHAERRCSEAERAARKPRDDDARDGVARRASQADRGRVAQAALPTRTSWTVPACRQGTPHTFGDDERVAAEDEGDAKIPARVGAALVRGRRATRRDQMLQGKQATFSAPWCCSRSRR